MDDRGYLLKIGSQEYELLMTMKATKEITKNFGNLEKMGEEIQKLENLEEVFDKIIGLVFLLVNQSVERYNFVNKENPKSFVTQEELELFMTIDNLFECFTAISKSMNKGAVRKIKSAEDPKKALAE
ncbi:hypothetical protein FACS1894132_09680 [Clostridia bacterium]|nr:hypothetical protein FACS1894132_09680 [Clostridia bacterium]